jgi:hypothetical protein
MNICMNTYDIYTYEYTYRHTHTHARTHTHTHTRTHTHTHTHTHTLTPSGGSVRAPELLLFCLHAGGVGSPPRTRSSASPTSCKRTYPRVSVPRVPWSTHRVPLEHPQSTLRVPLEALVSTREYCSCATLGAFALRPTTGRPAAQSVAAVGWPGGFAVNRFACVFVCSACLFACFRAREYSEYPLCVPAAQSVAAVGLRVSGLTALPVCLFVRLVCLFACFRAREYSEYPLCVLHGYPLAGAAGIPRRERAHSARRAGGCRRFPHPRGYSEGYSDGALRGTLRGSQCRTEMTTETGFKQGYSTGVLNRGTQQGYSTGVRQGTPGYLLPTGTVVLL